MPATEANKGDTAIPIQVHCTRVDDAGVSSDVDLTGRAPSDCTFLFYRDGALDHEAPATGIDVPGEGKVSLDPPPEKIRNQPGTYLVYVRVDFGAGDVQTFPKRGAARYVHKILALP